MSRTAPGAELIAPNFCLIEASRNARQKEVDVLLKKHTYKHRSCEAPTALTTHIPLSLLTDAYGFMPRS
jgi:hypothetical protein